jgi:uncharacterized protein
MPFAIHQSQSNLKVYLFTRKRDDFSCIPEGLLEELGKIRFLRSSLPYEKETEKIAPYFKEIENFVNSNGYYVARIE